MKINAKYAIQLAGTLTRCKKYAPHIVANTILTVKDWNIYKKLIIKVMGVFNQAATYCGPGYLGDLLVPDFIFKFAGYIHDGFYKLIEMGLLPETFKDTADEIFYIIMKVKAVTPVGDFLAGVYYVSVLVFGNPKKQETRLYESTHIN